jgi:hypothetical protein
MPAGSRRIAARRPALDWAEPLLRRSSRAGGRAGCAQVDGCFQCLWETVGDLGSVPYLALIWHALPPVSPGLVSLLAAAFPLAVADVSRLAKRPRSGCLDSEVSAETMVSEEGEQYQLGRL